MIKNKILLGGIKGAKLGLLRVREKEKKQEKELYEREHPYSTKIEKGIDKIEKKVSKLARKKLVSRKVLKSGKVTLVIKQREIEPYKPIYFKEELENEKRSMYFS